MGYPKMGTTIVKTSAFEIDVMLRLRRLSRRLRSYALISGLAVFMVIAMAASMIQLGLDYTLRLRMDMRAAMLGAVVVCLAIVAWRRIWVPLRFRFGLGDIACLIERRHPQLHSLIISAVQFAGGEVGEPQSNSRELMREVVEQAGRRADEVDFEHVLNHRPARQGMVTIIAVIAVAVTSFLTQPAVMGMWFDRNVLLSDREWPKRTHLRVHLKDGYLRGARGDDLELQATAEGQVPRHVDITVEYASGKIARDSLIAVGQRSFRYTFSRVDDDFRFRLTGGDDETRWFESALADRPVVEELTVRVNPPAYTGMDPVTLPPGQHAAEVLAGSDVSLSIRTNKDVQTAELMSAANLIGPADGTGRHWTIAFVPDSTQTFHFKLVDELQLEDKSPLRISIRVIKDDAPRVRFRITGVSDIVTPQAVLPIEMSFADTYGLAAAEMMYALSRDEMNVETVEIAEFVPGMTKLDVNLDWPLGPITVVPGERLTLSARAEDYDDISGPNQTQTAPATLRVVSRDEFLAELARREQEYRQEFERVIVQQEELRNRLLTLIRTMADSTTRDDLSNRVANLERRQRQIAAQVNILRQQFDDILLELRINGLDSIEVQQRLADGVALPLDRIVRRDLVTAVDDLRSFGRSGTAETAAEADARQAELLTRMREILSNMLKWEGYQEAVTMLREILRLQDELRAETEAELERRAADLLRGG